MITAHDLQYAPGAIRRKPSDPDHNAANHDRIVAGKLYAVADNFALGYEGATHDQVQGAGLLFVSQGETGLSVALSPTSMRELAASLVKLADLAEETAKRTAAEALNKAAGK